MQDDNRYIDPSKATMIRLIHEEGITSAGDWAIDGSDGHGYTEAIEGFPTRELAENAVPAFRREYGIAAEVPIREFDYT